MLRNCRWYGAWGKVGWMVCVEKKVVNYGSQATVTYFKSTRLTVREHQ